MNLFPHGRYLLCRPAFYGVKYKINPWMDVAVQPRTSVAQRQWQMLHHTLIKLGVWVEYVEPYPSQPDMVFTANAGLVRGTTAVLAKFKFPERQGEEPGFRAWFEANGFTVVESTKGSFEGEGDALFAGTKLFCGYGFRSDLAVCDEVGALTGASEVIACELSDPRFYHLDTCFTPLSERQALFFPKAFSQESIKRMEKSIELIPVPEDDALKFACNAVVLAGAGATPAVVLPANCVATEAILTKLGFHPYGVELGEYLKAGGSAKCLSLKLQN